MSEQFTAPLPPIAVTMGDPGGCGPQITLDAWRQRREMGLPPFFVIASLDVLRAADRFQTPLAPINKPRQTLDFFDNAVPVLPISCPAIKPGEWDTSGGDAVVASIEKAALLVRQGLARAMTTNPINKSLLYATGFDFPGHTEFLAELARRLYELEHRPKPVMLLTGAGLRVALATIHIPLQEVPRSLSQAGISETVAITHQSLQLDFQIAQPRIALAGLNPHAGEDGKMGQEEITIINPAAQALRDRGMNVSDAQPGDTVFAAMLDGQFDAVIAMYHDQGLAPLKTLDMWSGVNTTIGLPFVRTSPDHGTAYQAAAEGAVRADSLIAALKQADAMSLARNSIRISA